MSKGAGGLLISVLAMAVPSPALGDCELNEVQKLSAPGTAGDQVGFAVATDGNVLVAGARFSDAAGAASGSAHVFRDKGAGFSAEQELVADDAEFGEAAGWAVAVDGPVIVMGVPFDEDAGSASGSAYVYRHDGSSWGQEAKLTASDAAPNRRFGSAVGVSGDVIVVGAHLDSTTYPVAGAAYVYRFDGSAWVQETKLLPADLAAEDRFGISVAVRGQTIVAGSYLDDDDGGGSGSAYVFRHDGASWVEEAKLNASDAATGDWFGWAVSIDGDDIIVGAPLDSFGTHLDHGSAYVFVYEPGPGAWIQQAKLNADDATEEDQFGFSVSVGDSLFVIGTPLNDIAGSASGSAYIFAREGGVPVQQSRLTATDAAADDRLGLAVAAGDGRAVVGAPFDDDSGASSGSVYVFEIGGPCANGCPGDINDDNMVDTQDLLSLLGVWGACPPEGECPLDLDGSGAMDVGDLLIILGGWGICP